MFDRRTPTIEAYEHNAQMRARYIEINSLAFVGIDQDDSGKFYPILSDAKGFGLPEDGRTFDTEQGVTEWAARFCPELPIH